MSDLTPRFRLERAHAIRAVAQADRDSAAVELERQKAALARVIASQAAVGPTVIPQGVRIARAALQDAVDVLDAASAAVALLEQATE